MLGGLWCKDQCVSSHPRLHGPSSLPSSSPLSRDSRSRLRKFDNDDIPQEKVARIYQEELVKLMSRPQEPPLPLPRDPQYPGILFPFLGQSLLFNRTPEDVKLALDAYHQELSKLQGTASGMGLGAAGMWLLRDSYRVFSIPCKHISRCNKDRNVNALYVTLP